MFTLETCLRSTSCRRCHSSIPAGVQHATNQYQDRAFWRVDRYCSDCSFTYLRPLVAAEIRRLRQIDDHVTNQVQVSALTASAPNSS